MGLRLLFLDYAKGMAILLLLLSHSIPDTGILKTWIFAFHMPIFFIVCGYLAYLKYPQGISLLGLRTYLLRRERNIVEPYLLFGFLLLCIFCVLDYLALGYVSNQTQQRFVKWIYLGGVESMWFLPVYFIAELLFLLSRHYLDDRYLWLFLIFVISLCYFGENRIIGDTFTGVLKNSMAGFVFVVIGYKSAYYRIEQKLTFFWVVLVFTICSITSFFLGFASIQEMKNPVIYFIDGMGMSMAIIAFFFHIGQIVPCFHRFITFFGRNTIIVVCTNNLLIEVLRLTDYKLTGGIGLQYGLFGDFIFFLILSCCEIMVIIFLKNKFPRKVSV